MKETLFIWSDKYSVGIPEIDQQHQRLVGLLNDLHCAIREHQGSDVARRILRDLTEYTRVHFATEESLMRISNFPSYKSHKAIHEDLIQQVSALQNKVDSGKTGISFELLHFLKNWLAQHIVAADQKFGRFFVKSIVQVKASGQDKKIPEAWQKKEISRSWWKFW